MAEAGRSHAIALLELAGRLRTRLGWFVKAVSRGDDAMQLVTLTPMTRR